MLWACDLNFVRGEDSWVRAQWAARPFIWHIYPQDENLHHVKLRAFLQKYAVNTQSLVDFSLCWNGEREGQMDALWTSLQAELPTIVRRAQQSGQDPQEFANHMFEHNHIPELVQEILRGKALATIVEAATVKDASGNVVELKNLRPDGTIGEPVDESAEAEVEAAEETEDSEKA